MSLLGPAPFDAVALLAEVVEAHHPELHAAGVTINLISAVSEGSDPVKLHGYPALAVVRINPYARRVEGVLDATITYDGGAWDDMGDDERRALLDHEATHLTLGRDKKGNPKHDKAGRPVLKMRLHDWQAGGFAVIARRHGKAAPEVRAMRVIRGDYGQLLWAWDDDNAMPDEPPGDVLPMAGGPKKPAKSATATATGA